MPVALRVLERVAERSQWEIALDHALVGGAAYEAQGHPISSETLAKARAADAVLFGAVGGPQWDKAPFDKRPEVAILSLRRELGLYANLRPSKVFAPLLDSSPLKPGVVEGMDLMIVRESTGGLYFGEPRGIEVLADGGRRGFNTESYSTVEIERIARSAFELARRRGGVAHSVEKANVMEAGLVWRETVQALRDAEYADIELRHMYADNCAMQMVKDPRQFDVILTTNLFGDILSDLASQATGSLGMLPSATLGAPGPDGRRPALYEPIHGSAPDIAGKGVANPLAMILSLAMMLRWSFGREDEARAVEAAVDAALANGARTRDLGGALTTAEMGDAVLAELG